jgi:hypothetical protein
MQSRWLVREGAEVNAEVVGPDDDGQDTFPESQTEEADSEEPGGNPKASHEGVLLDFDFFRGFSGLRRIFVFLTRHTNLPNTVRIAGLTKWGEDGEHTRQ